MVESQGLPPGWKMAEAVGEHLSIGCPPDWHTRNVSGEQFEKRLQQLGQQSSRAGTAAQQGIDLERKHAYKIVLSHGKDPATGFSPTVAVMAEPSSSSRSFSEVTNAAVEQLRAKYPDAVSENISLPSGQAVKISFNKEATYHPGLQIQTTIYYVPDSTRIVVISMAVPTSLVPTLAPECDQMVQTLRL